MNVDGNDTATSPPKRKVSPAPSDVAPPPKKQPAAPKKAKRVRTDDFIYPGSIQLILCQALFDNVISISDTQAKEWRASYPDRMAGERAQAERSKAIKGGKQTANDLVFSPSGWSATPFFLVRDARS